jgi:type IV fimbrial biogenesis protein FimT
LYELLASLAIATTLTTIGANLYPLVLEQRLIAQVNGFLADLHLARSEAIKRGTPVTLCTSADGLHCHRSAPWESGWIIFSDLNGNRRVDSGETILRVQSGLDHGNRLSLRASFGHNNDVTYRPGGFTEKNGTFTFCDQRGESAARAVILFRTGRPRFSMHSAEDKKLSCRE